MLRFCSWPMAKGTITTTLPQKQPQQPRRLTSRLTMLYLSLKSHLQYVNPQSGKGRSAKAGQVTQAPSVIERRYHPSTSELPLSVKPKHTPCWDICNYYCWDKKDNVAASSTAFEAAYGLIYPDYDGTMSACKCKDE